MTVDKLKNIHRSRPVNPTLANPVYLTGYIEQMGTGTTDIIERCEKHGLRTPEFIQDEDFTTIIWRPNITQNSNHQTAHETDLVLGHEIGHESEQVRRLVSKLRDSAKTREEIMSLLNLKGRDNFRANYLTSAISAGLVAMLYPDNPKRKGQAYYLTSKGLKLLNN